MSKTNISSSKVTLPDSESEPKARYASEQKVTDLFTKVSQLSSSEYLVFRALCKGLDAKHFQLEALRKELSKVPSKDVPTVSDSSFQVPKKELSKKTIVRKTSKKSKTSKDPAKSKQDPKPVSKQRLSKKLKLTNKLVNSPPGQEPVKVLSLAKSKDRKGPQLVYVSESLSKDFPKNYKVQKDSSKSRRNWGTKFRKKAKLIKSLHDQDVLKKHLRLWEDLKSRFKASFGEDYDCEEKEKDFPKLEK